MALYKSTYAANVFATPKVLNSPGNRGALQYFGTAFQLTTAHDANDVIALMPIPSNFRPFELLYSTDGGATAGAANVGLHTLSKDGSAVDTVVDVDLFASAQVVTSAALRTDIFEESTTLSLEDRGKYMWELADIGGGTYTADPKIDFWLTLTISTNIDATTETRWEMTGIF